VLSVSDKTRTMVVVVNILYWIRQDGKESGPFTFGQIQHMWRAGNLKLTDEFRRDGRNVWHPVSKMRRSLETSHAAAVGYGLLAGVLASILVGLISWVLYLVLH
jgi:GYF domain 2